MSAALLPARTRDGGYSVAAAIEAGGDEDARVRIDVDGALAWAKANGVQEKDGRLEVGRVNARRAELGLPLFLVTKAARPMPMLQEVPHGAGRSAALDAGRREAFAEEQPATQGRAAEPVRPVPAVPPICHTQDEFLRLVTEEDGTITGLVTPTIAGWLMDLNTGNRPLQSAGVDRFVAILRAGTWINTGEPAIVSREGVINDGQHRLAAIVKSGISAVMDVRFGIERAAFAATGTGIRRTAGNVLAIAGQRFASSQASIARLLHHYDAGQMARTSQQVEPAEIIRIVEANPAILQVASTIQKHRFAPARTAPFGLILAVALRGAPAEKVFAFAEQVNSGLTDREDSPARQLHLRLRDAQGRRERMSQIDVAALTARAWNAWVEGRQLQRLVMQDGDRTSEGFPPVVQG